MEAYKTLAGVYDRLTGDVDYPAFFEFYQRLMQLYGVEPQTVLDLGCGTGSLSLLLAQAGYRVTGVDCSEEMLTQAYAKALSLKKNRPLFVHQSMEKLRLPAPVDCAVCCLDALDYLTKPDDCREAIRRVGRSLRPGGLFLFDVNTPAKLQAMDGEIFLDEQEAVYCVWRGSFDAKENICTYGMDIFTRKGDCWHRSSEEHSEYAYSAEQLSVYLGQAGFTDIRVFADRRLEQPAANEQRIFFAAKKE